ncbi:hypothetical protein IQ249_10395 [Lusitaniella coriacea LEGE 07157]|uniref:Uncharacterized protein n=1 Tax=Lusitaniella coriacea LEGE 07157 TaxID=945747 RepID=A0A8J7DYW0_9CYAN|nr:hypothetical protein [Lusitaniella coriacea]MBE9116306.1 hypothetical protein [Lusitaniella coriacea LEGE 07157]
MLDRKKIAEFRKKYNITQDGSRFLYFILAKAEIDIDLLNDIDWDWLRDNNFQRIKERLEQKKKEKENQIERSTHSFLGIFNKYSFLFVQASQEMLTLKHQIKFEQSKKQSLKSTFFSILQKIDSLNELTAKEVAFLKKNNLDENEFVKLLNFLELKKKYGVTLYSSNSPKDRLYKILSKLENEIQLTDKDIRFIAHKDLNSVLQAHEKQQKQRAEEFAKLKEKYQATQCPETSVDSSLYKILRNIEACQSLRIDEINWLNSNDLNDVAAIADFVALKFKYQATENPDFSISSHLYKVLKRIDSDIALQESDINFLKKRKLIRTISLAIEKYSNHLINEIAQGKQLTEVQQQWIERNERNDVITLGETKYFKDLKRKYDVHYISDDSLKNPLYLILQKLENNRRLDAVEIAYCKDKNIFHSKIYICYHKIEAQFYEDEYKKTYDKWNIPNISSHWRKANESKKALQSTANINLDKIKNNKLKSAILTTRGGAFRDFHELAKAEECARKAIKFQSSSHHPYTLMGAICYDRYEFTEGDRWFNEAIKRGASPGAIDSEIKKSIMRMKNRKEKDRIIKALLKKDPERYSWAERYLSKNSRKK